MYELINRITDEMGTVFALISSFYFRDSITFL